MQGTLPGCLDKLGCVSCVGTGRMSDITLETLEDTSRESSWQKTNEVKPFAFQRLSTTTQCYKGIRTQEQQRCKQNP